MIFILTDTVQEKLSLVNRFGVHDLLLAHQVRKNSRTLSERLQKRIMW